MQIVEFSNFARKHVVEGHGELSGKVVQELYNLRL